MFAGDLVKVNGQVIEAREADSLASSSLEQAGGHRLHHGGGRRTTSVDFVNHSTRIFPIGRLDKDSQGSSSLTNHGDLVNKILRAGNDHEKEYLSDRGQAGDRRVYPGMAAGCPSSAPSPRSAR